MAEKTARYESHLPDAPTAEESVGRLRRPIAADDSCVAELTHALLALAGFFCLALWQGAGGLLFSLGCLAANLPYVVIQRYNRPRLMRLLSVMPKREKTTENKTTAEKNLRPNPEENQ